MARRTDGETFAFAVTRAMDGGARSQLLHACACKLANDGKDLRSLQGYLGRKNVQNAVGYTELTPMRLKGFWRN